MFLQRLLRLVLVPVLFMATLSTATLHAKEMSQTERNEMAAKLIPIITMLLMDDGDRVAPLKPTTLKAIPVTTTQDKLVFELVGETGADVYVDGNKTATINSDGKVALVLSLKSGQNHFTIILKDKAGNESNALDISILYDRLPTISLLGERSLVISKGNNYVELGAIADDPEDGNITNQIVISGNVDTSTVGNYVVTYEVNDSVSHNVSVVRAVEVIALEEVATEFSVVESNLTAQEASTLNVQGLIEDSEGNTGSIGGLTDVVATNTVTYSDGNGNTIEDKRIVFRSFNIGEWIGKLNEETTLLARIFMHPYLIELPDATKIEYVEYLKNEYANDMNKTLKYQNLANESDFFSPQYYDMISSLQTILEEKYSTDLAAQQALQKNIVKYQRGITRKYTVGDDDVVNMALMQLEPDADGETINFYNYADVYYGLRLHKVGKTLQPVEYPTFPTSKLHIVNPVSGGAIGGLLDWAKKTYTPFDLSTSGTVKYNSIMNSGTDIQGENTALIELYKWKYKTLDYTTIMNSAKGISLIIKTVLSLDKENTILKGLKTGLEEGKDILAGAEKVIHGIDFALTIGDSVVQIMGAFEHDDETKKRLDALSDNIRAYDATVSTLYSSFNVQPYSANADEISSLKIVQVLFGGLLVDIPTLNANAYTQLQAKIDDLPKNTTQGIGVLASAAFLSNIIHKFIAADQEGKDKIKAFNDKYKSDTISFNQMPYYLALRKAGLIRPSDIGISDNGMKMHAALFDYGKTFLNKKTIASIQDSFFKYIGKMGSLAKSMNFIKKYTSNAISGVNDKSAYEISLGIAKWLIESELVNVKQWITRDGIKMMAAKAAVKIAGTGAVGATVKVAQAVNDWSSYLVGNFGISNSQYFQVDFTNGSVEVSLPPVSFLGLENGKEDIKPKFNPLNYLIENNRYLAVVGGDTGTIGHVPTFKLYFMESNKDGIIFDGDLEDLLETDAYKNKIIFDFDLYIDKATSNTLQHLEYQNYSALQNIAISSENIISADLASGENGTSTLDLMEAWAEKGTDNYIADNTRGIFQEYVKVKMRKSLDEKFVIDDNEVTYSQKIIAYKIWGKAKIQSDITLKAIMENGEKKSISIANNATHSICYEVKYEKDVAYTPYDRQEYDSGCIEAGEKTNISLAQYKDIDDTFNDVVFYFYDGLANRFFDEISIGKPYLFHYNKLHYYLQAYAIAYSINLEDIVEFTNTPPVANAGADQYLQVGQEVVLDGSQSSDSDGNIVSYEWEDSQGYIMGRQAQATVLSTLPEGDYTFTLTVWDDDGLSDEDNVTVTVLPFVTPTPTPTLKKTGQTTSYYTGDDGTYQAGVTPSYSRANEVVTDNVTGLQWQDNVEAKTITKNWADAQTYCSSLGLDGGGWRLPTVQELQSIVLDGVYNPSIDTTAFVNYTGSNYYWSSTTSAGYTSYAWVVDFYGGYTNGSYKTNTYYVRCVR